MKRILMRFISAFVSYALLSAVIAAKAEAAVDNVGAYFPVVFLNMDLTLQRDQNESPLYVQDDGFIRFQLDVPVLGEEFFGHHHLYINLPYFSQGSRKNHYIEVRGNGSIPINIPSEEPAGTAIYLYDGIRKPLKSLAERVITPIAQFLVVYEMLNFVGMYENIHPYRSFIDFKNGAFLEGIQGYALLDSSLRFSQDAAEHLEVYYQMNPDTSDMTVLILFAAGAILLNDVPVDSARFDAVAMQKSFINSGLAGKIVDVSDDMLITPKFSEALFPSRSSVRSFRSKLSSQTIRGPVLSFGISKASQLPDLSISAASSLRIIESTPAKWVLTKKLMIKATAETRQFNEMLGQSIDAVPDRIVEWTLNGATVAVAGVDGPAGSLKQTFNDEFQKQIGSHAHKQIKELKDKKMESVLIKSHPLFQTVSQILIDFSIGGMISLAFAEAEFKIGKGSLISGRIGKGIGQSVMLRTLGNSAIEPIMASANHFVYGYMSEWIPAIAPLFRRDYLVEIDHGITPERPDLKQSPSGSRAHDEL